MFVASKRVTNTEHSQDVHLLLRRMVAYLHNVLVRRGSKLGSSVALPTLETCSLPYHKGERPEAQAKQSIVWYSDDKQCLLYLNVNQMIT
jgi:hypothetical protein